MATVIGCFILLVAYLAFPGAFSYFFQYIHHMFFSILHSSFGQNPLSGHENHTQHLHSGASGAHTPPNNAGALGGSSNQGTGQ